MDRIRGMLTLTRLVTCGWFSGVEAHFVIDTLVLGLMAASLALESHDG
jgi:hypothetical protein